MKRLLLVLTGVTVISLNGVYAQNVEFIASYDTPGSALGVFVSGQLAYVAQNDSGLLILDVSDPSNPASVGSLETGYLSHLDVSVSGNYAYMKAAGGVYYWSGAIEIVDVSDPAAPDSVGGVIWGGYPIDFFVSGNYAYLTWTNYQWICQLDIIDVTDPDSAFLVGPLWTNCGGGYSCPHAIFVSGSYLYVGCGELSICDISDPYNPAELGFCWGGCNIYTDIFVAGGHAYCACDEGGLSVVNVANPSDPYHVGSFDTQGPARDVFVSGNYAYVAERDSGLQIFDISEPANPVLAGGYDTPGYARRIYVQDDFIYVADTSSLIILRFNPQIGIEEIGNLPIQLALNQNYPNPFNATTRIDFDIPALSNIDIAVYDILGRRVATLFEGQKKPGHHNLVWDATDFPSGIYFARLRAGSQSEVTRMTLLK